MIVLFPLIFALCDDLAMLKEAVETLAADSMRGRQAGGEGERKARAYVEKRFKELGLASLEGSYTQEFQFPQSSGETVTATNVTGWIDNRAASTIMIGAHYDHLGFGGPKSRSLVDAKLHPGADDNASGVSVMLLIAERLKRSDAGKFDYLFVAFSGHEDGLYGSSAFAASKLCDSSRVRLMVNLDMIGKLNRTSPTLRVMRPRTCDALDRLLERENAGAFGLRVLEEGLKDSDAFAFTELAIPAISLTTGPHEDYHKISDTPEKLNYEGMVEIAGYIERFLHALAEAPK